MNVMNVLKAVFICCLIVGGYDGRENSGNCTKSMLDDMSKRVSSCREKTSISIISIFNISDSPLDQNDFYKYMCALLFTLRSCKRDAWLSLSCLSSGALESVRVSFNASNNVYKYLCDNKAQRYIDFDINKGFQCREQAENDFETCLNGTAMWWNDFKYGLTIDIQTYCRNSETIKKCMTDKMESYPDYCSASAVKTISETIDIYTKSLGCNGSLKNETTKQNERTKGGYDGRENYGNCTKSMFEERRKIRSSCTEQALISIYPNISDSYPLDKNEFYKYMCAFLFTSRSCKRDATLSLSCLSSGTLEYIRVSFNAANNVYKYLCDNKAQRFIDFDINKGFQCTEPPKNDFETCLNGTAMWWNGFKYGLPIDIQTYCRDSETIKKCITDKMESYPDYCSASAVKTISETIDIYTKSLGCNGSLKNETTKQNERTKGGYQENLKNCTKSMLEKMRKRRSSCIDQGYISLRPNRPKVWSNSNYKLYEYMCALLSMWNSCRRDARLSLSCLSSGALEYVRVSFNASNNVYKYLCDNKAQRYFDFVKNKVHLCMKQAENDTEICLNGTAMWWNGFDYGFDYGLPIDIQTYCRDSETIKKCMIDTMESYPDNCSASAVKTFSEILDIYNENFGCNGSLKIDRTKGGYQENLKNCTKSMLEKMRKRVSSCNEPLAAYGQNNFQSISLPINELFENICTKLFTKYSCTRDVMSLTCHGSKYLEYIRVGHEALIKSTEYLCDNKAQRYVDFYINKGFQCREQAENDFMTCLNGTATLLNGFEYGLPIDIQTYCRDSETIKKCIIDTMESNPDNCSASVVETVSETLDIYKKNLGCNGSL